MDELRKIGLSDKLHKKVGGLVNLYLNDKFIDNIRNTAHGYGLEFNIQFEIVIISSKEKYLFNYLSGAFGNNKLEKGVKNIYKFIEPPRFKRLTKHLSGRAICDKDIVKRVESSLDYFTKCYGLSHEKGFVTTMNFLCNKIMHILNENKYVVLLGVPLNKEVGQFKKLLAHELFHLILINNGFWFQGIKAKYDYLDEELANLLVSEFVKDEESLLTNLWTNTLHFLNREERLKKLIEVKNKLKVGFNKEKLFVK